MILSSRLVISSVFRRSLHSASALNSIFKVQTPAEFDEKVLKSKVPVVVDFFAT